MGVSILSNRNRIIVPLSLISGILIIVGGVLFFDYSKFKTLTTSADVFMNSKNYDDAISSFNSAKTYAVWPGEKQLLDTKITTVQNLQNDETKKQKAEMLNQANDNLALAKTDISNGKIDESLSLLDKLKTDGLINVDQLYYDTVTKKVKQDENSGKVDDALLLLKKTNVQKLPNINKLVSEVDLIKSNLDIDSGIAKAKKLWMDGKEDQAIATIQETINIKGDKDKIDSASQLLAQYKSQYAIDRMRYFEGDGNVKIAVSKVELHSETDSHTAGNNATFVYVYVAVKNFGTDIAQANPMNFTLSGADGQTSSIDQDTFGLSNYLDATDIRKGQQASGWIVFYAKKGSQYTLNYQDFNNTAEKTIVIN